MRKPTQTIAFEPEQLRELREMAKKTRVPISEIVRQGVGMALIEFETRLEAQELGLKVMASNGQG